MKIIRDFEWTLDPGQALNAISRGRIMDRMAPDVNWALELAEKHWQPAALLDYFPVLGVDGPRVRVGGGDGRTVEWNVGPLSRLLEPARVVQVSVVTIGFPLEELIRDASRQNDLMKSFCLDSVGVLALGEIGQAVRRIAEDKASENQWGVSASLSPGSLTGWELDDQRAVCSLLPLQDIGMNITDSNLLLPLKSATSVIGLGEDYKSATVGSVCKYCMHKKTCWRRRDG